MPWCQGDKEPAEEKAHGHHPDIQFIDFTRLVDGSQALCGVLKASLTQSKRNWERRRRLLWTTWLNKCKLIILIHARYACTILPWWLSGKESTCHYRWHRFDPWAGKIPWRRTRQQTPVFFPEKSHEQRNLAGGYSPRVRRVDHNLAIDHTYSQLQSKAPVSCINCE